MGASLGYSAIIYVAPVTTENYLFAITTFPQLTFPLEISKSELLRSKLSFGIRCSTAQIFVTAGYQGALGLITRTLLAPGDVVWFENPGYFRAREALAKAGATIVPVPVARRTDWRVIGRFPGCRDDVALAASAQRGGLGPFALSSCAVGNSVDSGLLLSFTNIPVEAAAREAQRLLQTIRPRFGSSMKRR
jgi:Aminotransferase class I and II